MYSKEEKDRSTNVISDLFGIGETFEVSFISVKKINRISMTPWYIEN